MPTRMYSLAKDRRWPVFAGCGHDCIYCEKSYKAKLKFVGACIKCPDCISFTPHEHPERLAYKPPRTKGDEFIFVGATGDISFSSPLYQDKVIGIIRANPNSTFLLQTKNPGALKSVNFPDNVILGTTLETNRADMYAGVSKAPLPEQRYKDLCAINHSKKMITCEPIIEFDPDIMKGWVRTVKPVMVWVGYDSHKSGLIEPPTAKVQQFIDDLRAEGFKVIEKEIRAPHPAPGSVVPRSPRRAHDVEQPKYQNKGDSHAKM